MATSLFCFFFLFTGILADARGSEDNKAEIRISQGQPTTIERFPSLVQVEFYYGSWLQSCAANILNENFVLSAAHCFHGASPLNRRIRAGSSLRNTGGVVVNVANAYIHPDYRTVGLDSDISVVQLASPLQYSSTIQPATVVYQGNELDDNMEVVAAGWGRTSQRGYQSDILLEITIYTINNQVCSQRNQVFFDQFVVTSNMICAGLLDIGGRDSCPGDSGGGLFYQNILIGIVSWGRGCGNYYFPGVYTKISPFRYWIESIVYNS